MNRKLIEDYISSVKKTNDILNTLKTAQNKLNDELDKLNRNEDVDLPIVKDLCLDIKTKHNEFNKISHFKKGLEDKIIKTFEISAAMLPMLVSAHNYFKQLQSSEQKV